MTDWLKDTARRLGLWLAGLGGWTPPGPEIYTEVCRKAHIPENDLTALAKRLVVEYQAQMPGASGEAKRHHVLARMKKAVPAERDRACALAIELAVQQVLP